MFKESKIELRLMQTRAAVGQLFNRLKSETIYDVVFKEEVVTEESFLQNNVCYRIFYEQKYVGVVWLNHFDHRTARINFCPFKTPHMRNIFGAAKWITENLMNHLGLDIIFGYIASSNKASKRIAFHTGFQYFGRIRNYFSNEDVLIYQKEK